MLINSLAEYRKRKGHDVFVVFDGWRSGPGKETISVTEGIRVIYSGIGDRADDVIKRMISSDKREWIVVTSDRDIADHTWSCGSTPVAAGKFLRILEEGSSFSDDDQEEDEEYIQPRKGSPRQLSRKEKAVRRALNKL